MGDSIAGPRCPICGNDRWHDRAMPECTHCGLVLASLDFDAAAMRHAIAASFAGGGEVGFALSPHARRNAGWALGYVEADGGWQRAAPVAADVTLGIIARAADSDAVSAMLDGLRRHFVHSIVLLDGTPRDAAALALRHPGIEAVAHPLNGDFAAQRNRVQMLANGWVLQLDTDERPDAALLAAIGWMTAAADRAGLQSLGLARRNLVDGTWSALWPDIQYRLNRAEVRFAGIVHERPAVPFAQTSLALTGAIEHRLDRARVVERSKVYAAMSADAGRPEDEAALLRPMTAAE